MKCPHCDQELKAPNYAFHNSDAYRQQSKVYTECCNRMVVIIPIRTFNVIKYEGKEKLDDWGNSPWSSKVASCTE